MHDFTKGSVTTNLLRMTSFMLVAMVFQTLYFLVDLYFVGRLGKSAVAAVSVSGNLMFVVLAATQMLSVGTTALVSHAVGRKDQPAANRVFVQAQSLSLVVGVAFFVIAMSTRSAYARAQCADAQTAAMAEAYLTWFVPTMALQLALAALSSALRGIGDFKPGMFVQSGTIVVNMVLAPLLIFGVGPFPTYGVAGAAIASFIAVVAGVLALGLYVARGQTYLRLAASVGQWRPDFVLWRRLLSIGLPAGAEFALLGVYLLVVYGITRPFGAAAQAGFGIGLRVVQAGMMPVVALGFAVSPVAGQNFGARLDARVRATLRVGAALAVAMMAAWNLVALAVPGSLVRLFSSDPQVVAVGAEYLGIICWTFVPSGVVFVTSSMFQALGNTIPSLVSSVVRMIVLLGPAIALTRVHGFQLRWIWMLGVAAVIVQVTINATLLRRELRRKLSTAAATNAAIDLA